jgi:hypothetical protein
MAGAVNGVRQNSLLLPEDYFATSFTSVTSQVPELWEFPL